MPFVKVWIHFVWSTKNREPFLSDDVRAKVFQHIRQNAKEKGIFLDFVSGYTDHIHCLVSIGTDQKISEIVKLIKGESSHWINQNHLTHTKFRWQHEYFAVGVCESILEKTRDYIRNQEHHHQQRSYQDEFDQMVEKYGFQRFDDDDS